jgi:hypothetical protein
VLDREHSRYRKFLQVQESKFVLAEVALRFWNRFDNFWMWSILPLYTKSNFWALEQALIQSWQPRRNIPFITNSSIAGKALSKEHRFRPRDSLEPFRCGGNCAGHPPQIPSDKPFAAALSTTE